MKYLALSSYANQSGHKQESRFRVFTIGQNSDDGWSRTAYWINIRVAHIVEPKGLLGRQSVDNYPLFTTKGNRIRCQSVGDSRSKLYQSSDIP